MMIQKFIDRPGYSPRFLSAYCIFWLFCRISAAATVEVSVRDFVFAPKTVSVQVGDTVHWNWIEESHTTTSGVSGTPDGRWDSGVQSIPFNFDQTFNQAGSFPYFCALHWQMGMTGTVIVRDANAPPHNSSTIRLNPASEKETSISN
jgi:plastocyanin